jgi:hypothetical protein
LEHQRDNEQETHQHRRYEDTVWVYRYRWFRRFIPILMLIGGFAWHEALEWAKGIPSKDKTAQYDNFLSLAPEFYRMQTELITLKRDIQENGAADEARRVEIIQRIDRLDDRLTKWFEGAAKKR